MFYHTVHNVDGGILKIIMRCQVETPFYEMYYYLANIVKKPFSFREINKFSLKHRFYEVVTIYTS
jgi:hypothetical protein